MRRADIKREALLLAGWLAPGEQMTSSAAKRSLHEVVAQIFASKDCTPVVMALVALLLADELDTPTT